MSRLPSGKFPGPDGVLNEMLLAVARWNPVSLLRAYNVCLRWETFPTAWKRVRNLL